MQLQQVSGDPGTCLSDHPLLGSRWVGLHSYPPATHSSVTVTTGRHHLSITGDLLFEVLTYHPDLHAALGGQVEDTP